VSFYIPSADLRDQATSEGFKFDPANPAMALNKHKYLIYGLKLTDLKKHEDLFRDIVKESVDFILGQRPTRK
jgi:hypothetical protein